jgi:hypothetical protein
MLNEAGFIECELVMDTGCNSSPVTKGVLFRARKPMDLQGRLSMSSNPGDALASESEAAEPNKTQESECST